MELNTKGKPIAIIVAIADNYGIGKNNDLLWHLSNDLKYFKEITTGHTVVMGKNTWESLPKKPLPNRKNIVITDNPNEKIDGCLMAYSLQDAVDLMDETSLNFIIGGASIYRQFFPYTQFLYLTRVFTSPEADTFFPQVEEEDWELIEESPEYTDEKNGLHYKYQQLQRK